MEEDNAMCLMARDYKGVGNQDMSGVAVYGAQLQGHTVGNNIDNAYTLAARDSKGLRFSDNQPDNIAVYPVEVSTTEVKPIENEAHALLARDYKGISTYGINDTQVYAVWHEGTQSYIAIRKLTPKECFRLQGWTDDYFEKAALVNSDTQLYKQAGNGITVNVVHAIAEMMNNATYENN